VASLTAGDWVLGNFVWDVSTVVIVRPTEWHAVWVCWRENGDAWGWYINLQRPFRRTVRGIQNMVCWPRGLSRDMTGHRNA